MSAGDDGGNVVDLSHALNVKKMLEGELFVYCPICESELICLSIKCAGQSFIPVFNGEVK